MAASGLQGNLVLVDLSFDDKVSYQTLVCSQSNELNAEAAVTEVPTHCGILTATGPLKFTLSGTGVFNPTYDDGTEVTNQELLDALKAKTLLYFRIDVGNYYRAGACKVSNVSEATDSEGFMTFSFTMTGQGELTTIKPA